MKYILNVSAESEPLYQSEALSNGCCTSRARQGRGGEGPLEPMGEAHNTGAHVEQDAGDKIGRHRSVTYFVHFDRDRTNILKRSDPTSNDTARSLLDLRGKKK